VPGLLGRLPHDPAAVARAPSLYGHVLASKPPPPKLLRDQVAYPFAPQMDANDQIGDCTAVGVANYARGVAALNGFGLPIPTDAVVGLYSASCGYVPGDPSTDQGGVELNVLAYQLQSGFPYGGQAPLVGDFATFDPTDRALFATTMANLGLVYMGVNLSVSDQASQTWDTNPPASAGDPTPGSWGGHCLLAWAYTGLADDDLVTLVTWGCLDYKATWRWVRARCEEAHAIIFPDLQQTNRLNFAGLDLPRMRAEGLAFTA
jgi:hypothetical protein